MIIISNKSRYNRLTHIPISLSHCVNMDEFTIEGNCVSQLPVRSLINKLRFILTIDISKSQKSFNKSNLLF